MSSYLLKLPLSRFSFSESFEIPMPAALEVSELEILRVALEKEKTDTTNLTQNSVVKKTLQSIFETYSLKNINPDLVLKQIQTLAHPPKYQTVYAKANLAPAFSSSNSVVNALHLAAREGNLDEVKKLIQNQYDVNAKDIFSTTPLHMAVMYGHQDVIAYLIEQGAQINSKAYISYKYFWSFNINYACTPLDLAVKYSPNLESLSYLIEHGAISANWDNLQNGIVESIQESLWTADYEKLDLILNKIELLSKISHNGLWVNFEEPIPMALYLQLEAQDITNLKFHQRLIETIDILSSENLTEHFDNYILAKNLLQVFPSYNDYFFQAGHSQILLSAAGYYTIPAINFAAHSLTAYYKQLNDNYFSHHDHYIYQNLTYQDIVTIGSLENYVNLKHSIFGNMIEIFDVASSTTQKAGLIETSEKLYEDYLSGKTILIATGWAGHAVDIILDKELNLFMVANAGNSNPVLMPGLNAYNLQFNISAKDIYNILNNQDEISLEFKLFYDLGLVKNEEFSFATDYQLYGNCAWYSHKIAEEALLFVELKKATHDHELSKKLTDVWFDELNNFNQIQALKDYMDSPFLEVSALGDILITYHNSVESDHQKETAKLILDTLNQPANIAAFNDYYSQHEASFSNELKLLITHDEYDFIKDNQNFNTMLMRQEMSLSLEDVIEQPNTDDPLAILKSDPAVPVPTDNSPSLVYRQPSVPFSHEDLPENLYS